MIEWILDTIIWTGVLIALVLVLRRPVTRMFGPGMAYALWTLPVIRVLLPRITLPAWMAPADLIGANEIGHFAGSLIPADEYRIAERLPGIPVPGSPVPGSPVPDGPASVMAAMQSVDRELLLMILLSLWAAGFVMFLYRRFVKYFAMRRTLLSEARPMGDAGRVRLVETPLVKSPIAFGVMDKVIAMPPGFMALTEPCARSFTLEHELEHHRGRDLLINMLVQPLFAIHWFNPLGWIGWRTLRQDQEAACDARVIWACNNAQKAAYGAVIAGFATSPQLSLSAAMARPVLGEKSIIYRLKILKMSAVSRRRRIAGNTILAGALAGLPFTGPIYYAQAQAPEPPDSPAYPAKPDYSVDMVTPPAPPATPQPPVNIRANAPDAVSLSPEAPKIADGEDMEREERTFVDGQGRVHREVRIVRRAQTGLAQHATSEHHAAHSHKRRIVIMDKEHGLSEEERAEIVGNLRQERGETAIEIDETRHQHHAMGTSRSAWVEMAQDNSSGWSRISINCSDSGPGVAALSSEGKMTGRVCASDIEASVLEGLQQARATIAQDSHIEPSLRAEILRSLDEKIANWDK